MTGQITGRFERYADIRLIAGLMGCNPAPSPFQRELLEQIRVYDAGYGSIARPASDRLLDFGLRDFVLADPKKYRRRSVASQCERGDVGRFKVHVGRQRLAAGGARVKDFCCDLLTLPDGLVSEKTIMLLSADNRRAEIGVNRLAARMSARLVKVNIEPAYHFISVRFYDFRRYRDVCIECQIGDRAYANQRHPKSCDRAEGRRTAAPRWLSRAAGNAAALAVAHFADDETAARWHGRQWHLTPESGRATWSELTASPNCRWTHDEYWPNLERLPHGPAQLSLAQLLDQAGASADAALRFCQQVSTRASCDRCGRMVERIRWLGNVDHPVGQCECRGKLLPLAYFTYRQIRASRLGAVLRRPLGAWGVPPDAVIEIAGADQRRSFVVGAGALESTTA